MAAGPGAVCGPPGARPAREALVPSPASSRGQPLSGIAVQVLPFLEVNYCSAGAVSASVPTLEAAKLGRVEKRWFLQDT